MLTSTTLPGEFRTRWLALLFAAACWGFVPGLAAASQEPEKPAKIDFHQQIMPIFAKRCHECHGEEKTEGDLRTDQRSSVLDEYFVTPGKADESLLYKVIVSTEDDRMPPPDEGEAVPEDEAKLIKAWIDQGAEWPEKTEQAPPPPGDETRVTKPGPQDRSPAPRNTPTATPGDAQPAASKPDVTKSSAATVAAPQEPAAQPAAALTSSAEQESPANPAKNASADQSPQSNVPPSSSPQGSETGQATAKSESAVPLSPRQEFWLKVWRAFGDLHPAVAHFPIALLIVGGISALFSFRGSYACADFAFYCLWLGALGAVVASGLGWSFAWNEGYNEDPFQFDRSARLFWHRWTGVALAILALFIALVATVSRRRDPEDGSFWRLGLIVLALLTSFVGHAGGELTHRRGYGKIWDLLGVQRSNSAPADAASPSGK